MIRKSALFLLLIFVFADFSAFAQEKRALQHEDVNAWTQLSSFQAQLSRDGNWAAWTEAPERGDGMLMVSSTDGNTRFRIPRASGALFSGNSAFVLFKIVAHADSVRQMKLDDVPKKDMPSDTLGILNLASGSIQKFADVTSFSVSSNDGALAAFKLTEKASKEDASADSSSTEEEPEVEVEEAAASEEEEDLRLVADHPSRGYLHPPYPSSSHPRRQSHGVFLPYPSRVPLSDLDVHTETDGRGGSHPEVWCRPRAPGRSATARSSCIRWKR